MGILKKILRWLQGRKESFDLYYINSSEVLPPPLTPEEEQALFERLEKGDETCQKELIVHNLRLVVYMRSVLNPTAPPPT